MPRIDVASKWRCDYCTYMNWPTSQKCVMCRFVNSNRVISPVNESNATDSRPRHDGGKVGSVDAETNRICQTKNDKDSSPGYEILSTDVRWYCPACTYQNYERSQHCTMCGTPQLKNTIETYSDSRGNSPTQGNNRLQGNPSQTEARKQERIERNRSNAATKTNTKWYCSICTYENWPKSMKCALCLQPKRQQKQEGPNGKYNEKSGSSSPPVRRSPPRSPIGACHRATDAGKPDQDDMIALSEGMARSCKVRNNDNEMINQIRNRMTSRDWMWLAACKAVVEHDPSLVTAYIAAGGDRTRMLTSDDALVLQRPGVYEVGHTLVHLAVRFHREDILRILLTPEVPSRAVKRLPCHGSPELAATIRKQLSQAIRQRKGDFACSFSTEIVTFLIPGEVEEFNSFIRHHILGEILDFDVQKVLEEECLINWSDELVSQYGSKIFPLWNRAAGDCLLDSVLQATWGVLDRDNVLRKTLYESLSEGERKFFPRWKEAEEIQASEMNYSLDEEQWRQDWENIISLAATVGNSLEQMHVFVLSHILRRPIIVYAVKYVKSRQGETIDMARFEGVYLPLLWEENFCWKSPLALGYTRGHFSALVPMETSNGCYAGAGANIDWRDNSHVTYLPLIDHDGQLLPIHFLTLDELGQEERLLQKRLDCCLTDGGILVAKQQCTPRPALVDQLMDEWMSRFRRVHVDTPDSRGGGGGAHKFPA